MAEPSSHWNTFCLSLAHHLIGKRTLHEKLSHNDSVIHLYWRTPSSPTSKKVVAWTDLTWTLRPINIELVIGQLVVDDGCYYKSAPLVQDDIRRHFERLAVEFDDTAAAVLVKMMATSFLSWKNEQQEPRHIRLHHADLQMVEEFYEFRREQGTKVPETVLQMMLLSAEDGKWGSEIEKDEKAIDVSLKLYEEWKARVQPSPTVAAAAPKVVQKEESLVEHTHAKSNTTASQHDAIQFNTKPSAPSNTTKTKAPAPATKKIRRGARGYAKIQPNKKSSNLKFQGATSKKT